MRRTRDFIRSAIAAIVLLALVLLVRAAPGPFPGTTSTKPNIVVILADDLGYGDVGCYNKESKVPTPHLDRLARQGIRFTGAHAPATVCTPSRYSVMTGRMCFRTGFRGGVFEGVGGPCLIEQERLTLPQMLRDQGYATACVGKWHIGMTFYARDGTPVRDAKVGDSKPMSWRDGGANLERVRLVDFTRQVTDGPFHRSSGGNNYASGELKAFALPDAAPDAPGQLYNLQSDPGEKTNLYFKHPEIVKELRGLLEASKTSGRTAPRSKE